MRVAMVGVHVGDTPVVVTVGVLVFVGVKVGVLEVLVGEGVYVNVLVGTCVPPGSLPQARVPPI